LFGLDAAMFGGIDAAEAGQGSPVARLFGQSGLIKVTSFGNPATSIGNRRPGRELSRISG